MQESPQIDGCKDATDTRGKRDLDHEDNLAYALQALGSLSLPLASKLFLDLLRYPILVRRLHVHPKARLSE